MGTWPVESLGLIIDQKKEKFRNVARQNALIKFGSFSARLWQEHQRTRENPLSKEKVKQFKNAAAMSKNWAMKQITEPKSKPEGVYIHEYSVPGQILSFTKTGYFLFHAIDTFQK